MNVLVIGAAGKLGREAVTRAAAAGHQVTAFVHTTPETPFPANVCTIQGDATDPASISSAVQGQHAVLDTLGGKTPYKETHLESTVARNIIAAMEQHGARRLVVTSMLGEGDSKANATFAYEHILMPTFLRGATPDKSAMESSVEGSSLEWVILRPAILTDDGATRDIRIYSAADANDKAHKISRADVAQFMVDQLTSDTHLRQAVTIATS